MSKYLYVCSVNAMYSFYVKISSLKLERNNNSKIAQKALTLVDGHVMFGDVSVGAPDDQLVDHVRVVGCCDHPGYTAVRPTQDRDLLHSQFLNIPTEIGLVHGNQNCMLLFPS